MGWWPFGTEVSKSKDDLDRDFEIAHKTEKPYVDYFVVCTGNDVTRITCLEADLDDGYDKEPRASFACTNANAKALAMLILGELGYDIPPEKKS